MHTKPDSLSPNLVSVETSGSGKWMVLLAAFLGWMFDGFEMGLFPLIGGPALAELLGPSAEKGETAIWFGGIIAVFLVGAATGGVLFGWLGDRIGRVRAMSLSIFTYAIFTGLCGFATEAWHIAILRFIASLGMGGEWSLGVALVNEIWPGKSRAVIAGLIGAAANVGFLLVALLSMALVGFVSGVGSMLSGMGVSEQWIDHLLRNSAWRFLMISGALPALLIFFIRMFVPESEKWRHEHARGATSHWANRDLLGVLVGCLASLVIIWAWMPRGPHPAVAGMITIVGLAVALVGYLWPVRGYLVRAINAGSLRSFSERQIVGRMVLGAVLAGVALLGTWGSVQWAPRWVTEDLLKEPLLKEQHPFGKEWTQIWSALGAIVGTMIAAICAGASGAGSLLLCFAPVRSLPHFTSTKATISTTRNSLRRCFWSGRSPRPFTAFSPCICPSFFQRRSEPPARGSPITSDAFWPRSADCRQPTSRLSSAAASPRPARSWPRSIWSGWWSSGWAPKPKASPCRSRSRLPNAIGKPIAMLP